MQSAVLSSGAFLGIVLLLTLFSKGESNPVPDREELLNYVYDEAGLKLRNPYLYELLANLEQDLMAKEELMDQFLAGKTRRVLDEPENSQIGTKSTSKKRGLDLGLSRGFSGSQAAKHLLGLAAANSPTGPGRKRRSLTRLS